MLAPLLNVQLYVHARDLEGCRGCPGSSVAKNLPCDAGDAGPVPGQGMEIPHAEEQRSPQAMTKESVRHNRDPPAKTKTQGSQMATNK